MVTSVTIICYSAPNFLRGVSAIWWYHLTGLNNYQMETSDTTNNFKHISSLCFLRKVSAVWCYHRTGLNKCQMETSDITNV